MNIKQVLSNGKGLGFAVVLALLTIGYSAAAQEEAAPEEAAPEAEPAPAAEEVAPAPAPAPAVEETATPEEVTPAAAEPEAETEAAEPEKKSVGINVDVGLATLYNFRGYNVFMENSMMDQNALFAPSVTWSIFDTGLSLGYWGAYQLSGNNKREMVDVGLGHEQDLILGYSKGFADDVVSLDLAFTYYFYPFAAEDADGKKNPSIIEPLVGISISTVMDLGFSISYFHAIQDSIQGLRHVYFNLSAGKSFAFNDIFGMDLGMGLGIKAWTNDNSPEDNRFDLHFDWSVPIHLTDQLYVAPALHFSWTDLKMASTGMDDDPATPDVDESTRAARAGDEYMIYASINFGADF